MQEVMNMRKLSNAEREELQKRITEYNQQRKVKRLLGEHATLTWTGVFFMIFAATLFVQELFIDSTNSIDPKLMVKALFIFFVGIVATIAGRLGATELFGKGQVERNKSKPDKTMQPPDVEAEIERYKQEKGDKVEK
jgi:hypothetical protein